MTNQERQERERLVDTVHGLRFMHDWTFARLAKAIGGLSAVTVHQVLTGTRLPTSRTVLKFKQFLKRHPRRPDRFSVLFAREIRMRHQRRRRDRQRRGRPNARVRN